MGCLHAGDNSMQLCQGEMCVTEGTVHNRLSIEQGNHRKQQCVHNLPSQRYGRNELTLVHAARGSKKKDRSRNANGIANGAGGWGAWNSIVICNSRMVPSVNGIASAGGGVADDTKSVPEPQWSTSAVRRLRDGLVFFPSNAFMASARSFNTFNCMLQITLQGLFAHTHGRPLIERPQECTGTGPECSPVGRHKVTTKQIQTPTKTHQHKTKHSNKNETAEPRCDRCQFQSWANSCKRW